MFELLQNKSHDNKHQMDGFYKVAYQTARERMGSPKRSISKSAPSSDW